MNLHMTDQEYQQYLESQPGLKWANDLRDAVTGGFIDPLSAYTMLHRLMACVKMDIEQVQAAAISEAEKYDGKTFEFKGYEITKKAAGGTWNYKHLADWNEAKESLKSLEEKHQMAFKMAEKGDKYVTEDGEEIEPASYTPGKDTISLKPIA